MLCYARLWYTAGAGGGGAGGSGAEAATALSARINGCTAVEHTLPQCPPPLPFPFPRSRIHSIHTPPALLPSKSADTSLVPPSPPLPISLHHSAPRTRLFVPLLLSSPWRTPHGTDPPPFPAGRRICPPPDKWRCEALFQSYPCPLKRNMLVGGFPFCFVNNEVKYAGRD